MRSYFRLAPLGLFLAASSVPASGNYFEVQHAANIRKAASSISATLAYPEVCTGPKLLDNGKQNAGYQHVAVPGSAKRGWIYTLVAMHPGDLSGATGSPPLRTPAPSPAPTPLFWSS